MLNEPKADAGGSAESEQGQSVNPVFNDTISCRSTTADFDTGARTVPRAINAFTSGTSEGAEKIIYSSAGSEKSDESSSSSGLFDSSSETEDEPDASTAEAASAKPVIQKQKSLISRTSRVSFCGLRSGPTGQDGNIRTDTRLSGISGGTGKWSEPTRSETGTIGTEQWHELHQTIWDCIATQGSMQAKAGKVRRMLSRRWHDFRFFGVNRNDNTPRVWGQRIDTQKNVSDRQTLTHMVQSHQHHDEMRLQLRDEKVRLQYLDAFRTDCEPDGWLIRVFSPGATLMEYMKLLISVWTFMISLTIVAFWKVLTPVSDEFLIIDCVIDLVYAFLLALQLRTTILRVDVGKEVCGSRKILHHHLKHAIFWIDVLSCIPLFILHAFTGDDADALVWVVLVKALRGWRINRLPPKHRFIPSMRFLLFRVCLFMLMFGHLLACIWFTLVYEMERGTLAHHVNSEEEFFKECASSADPPRGCFSRLYSVSINQGIYLLMGIDRDAYSALEHFFLTFCMPLGALVHAYVLGEIIMVLQRRGALETRQNEHNMAVQEAMRILGLSPSLQVRIITYFTFERLNRCGGLFHELFEDLSPQLRFELQLQLYLDLVVQSGLFKHMRPRVIREIVVHLKDLIFLPGDWICRYGDYGDSMYFIVSGSCKIIAKDTTTELRVLTNGCYFGEVALLTGVPRTAYVLASAFCTVAHLTKEVFEPIVRKWPEEIDNLLRGVEKESDRHKIREEAKRYYNLINPTARRGSTTANRRESGAPLFRRQSGAQASRSSTQLNPAPVGGVDDPKVNHISVAPPSSGLEAEKRRRFSEPPEQWEAMRPDATPIGSPESSSQQDESSLSPILPGIGRSGTCPLSSDICSASAPPDMFASMLKGAGLPNGALSRQVLQTALERHRSFDQEAEKLRGLRKSATFAGKSNCAKALQKAATFTGKSSESPAIASRQARQGVPEASHGTVAAGGMLLRKSSATEDELEGHRQEHAALIKERDFAVEQLESELADLAEAVAKLDSNVQDHRKFITLSRESLRKVVFDSVREAVSSEVVKVGTPEQEDEESVMLEAMVI